MAPEKPPLKAVILDIDGTLLDSNDAHARAWVDAATEAEYPLSFERVRCLIGMGGDRLLKEIGLDDESQLAKHLSSRSTDIFSERYLPTLQPFPGTRALVERLRAQELTLVVATSAGRDLVEGLLNRAGIIELIDDTTTASEVEESKPSPAIVYAALEKAGCSSDQALMLGDTPFDIEAASRAGVGVVGVRCGGWSDEALEGALAIYDGPADLLAQYHESPFSRSSGRFQRAG